MPWADFDRFDICEAYAVLEWDYNSGGWLQERPSNVRRGQARGYVGEATSIQLDRMQFRARPNLSFDTLTDNGRRIYMEAVRRWHLPEPEYDGGENIYAADVYCDVCAERLRHDCHCPGDKDDETTYDSGDYPKGPYDLSESDCPQHCAGCGIFLANPLTTDGAKYVRETASEDLEQGRTDSVCLRVWVPHYSAQGYSVDPLALPIYYRVGDAGDYHECEDAADLAQALAVDGVRGTVERHGRYGLGADGFRGMNYISAYHGWDVETPLADLTGDELAELNTELAREVAAGGGSDAV